MGLGAADAFAERAGVAAGKDTGPARLDMAEDATGGTELDTTPWVPNSVDAVSSKADSLGPSAGDGAASIDSCRAVVWISARLRTCPPITRLVT